MLARLQQCVTLGLALAVLAAFGYGIAVGSPSLAMVAALAILIGYAGVMSIEFVLLWWVSRRGPGPRAAPSQLARAWVGEVTTAPRVFCWAQPFRSNLHPNWFGSAAEGRRGVVFIHGFICNRGLWNPWLRQLPERGVPFMAVNLEPVFGSIDEYPALIEEAVLRITSATGQAPVLVAHSMGGLAVRAWLVKYRAAHRVHRVVTIATPHHGTFLARFSFTTNARQMQLESPWLQQLAEQENADTLARFTCFYGHCDNIVFPVASATLPGADNRHVPQCAHVHMARHEAVFSEILRWLETDAAGRCQAAMTR